MFTSGKLVWFILSIEMHIVWLPRVDLVGFRLATEMHLVRLPLVTQFGLV